MDATKGKPKDQKEAVQNLPADSDSALSPPPAGESAVKDEEGKVSEKDGAAKGGKVSSLKLSANPPSSSSSSGASVPTDPELQKKFRRAERFGLPVQLSEEEKRSSRSQRFGLSSPHGPGETTKSEEDKKKARAERFGLSPATATDEEAKKKARLARFAPVAKVDAVEEDKRKARAARFSKPASGGTSEANGQVKTEMLGSVG
ncbi:unnamed protein product [Victoria cruziana]